MALDTGFVVAVLEGIEGTLGELIERVDTSELQASLDVLQSRVTAFAYRSNPRRMRRRESTDPKNWSPSKRLRPCLLSCPRAFCPQGQPQQSSRTDTTKGAVFLDGVCAFLTTN